MAKASNSHSQGQETPPTHVTSPDAETKRTNELSQYSPFLSFVWSSVTPTGCGTLEDVMLLETETLGLGTG